MQLVNGKNNTDLPEKGLPMDRTPKGKALLHNYQGEYITSKQISEITGIDHPTISSRLSSGWSPDKTISTVKKEDPTYEYQGRQLTVLDIVKITNIEVHNIRHWLRKGWTAQEVIDYFNENIVNPEKYNGRFKIYKYNDKHYLLRGLLKFTTIPYKTLLDRLHSNMTIEEALIKPIKLISQ